MNKQRSPKFLLSDNLMRLAKWLRILGYDAAIYRSINIDKMIYLANRERRVMVTRSKKIINRNQKFSRLFICNTNHLEQLQEMLSYIRLDEKTLFSHCTECNVALDEISREKVTELVPKTVLEEFYNFWICRRCGRIYWRGSHYHKMRDQLRKIFQKDRTENQ